VAQIPVAIARETVYEVNLKTTWTQIRVAYSEEVFILEHMVRGGNCVQDSFHKSSNFSVQSSTDKENERKLHWDERFCKADRHL
jgi:hypothetical protein